MPTCCDTRRPIVGWSIGLAALVAWGCSQDSTGLVVISDGANGVTQGMCLPGSAGCECLADQTCDVGLSCTAGTCVTPGAAPASAGPSSSTTAAPATGAPLGTVPAASPTPAAPAATPGEPEMPGAAAGGAAPVATEPVPTMMERVPLPPGVNAVENGDFASGDTYWRVDDGAGNAVTHSTTSGAMCVTVGPAQPTAVIRWPLDGEMGVKLAQGTHQFTYDAWSTQPTGMVFEAKIGAAIEPFMDHFVVEVELGPTAESFSHGFNARSSATTGVAFQVSQVEVDAQVCIDNVSLKGL